MYLMQSLVTKVVNCAFANDAFAALVSLKQMSSLNRAFWLNLLTLDL